MKVLLSGNEAIARGAYEAGVQIAAAGGQESGESKPRSASGRRGPCAADAHDTSPGYTEARDETSRVATESSTIHRQSP